MKKIIFAVTSLAIAAVAQTTVVYNPDIYAVGTEFTNRVIDDAVFVPGAPGSGSWNFIPYTGGNTASFSSIAYNSSIPYIGECAVTPNYILYYHNTTDTTETEGWGFSYQTSGFVDGLGLYGTLVKDGTTYKLMSMNDSYSHMHTFPINYGDEWVEWTFGNGYLKFPVIWEITVDFSFQDTNWYSVDGYGTITLPTGTYNALRVKKRHWRHSWSSHITFGFDKTERRVSYLWFCTEMANAVSFAGPIDSTGGLPDSTFTTGQLTFQIANNSLSIAEILKPDGVAISAFPNPFNGNCRLMIDDLGMGIEAIEIFDVSGRIVDDISVGEHLRVLPKGNDDADVENGRAHRPSPTKTAVIWQPSVSLPSGIYLVRARAGENIAEKRIVYLK